MMDHGTVFAAEALSSDWLTRLLRENGRLTGEGGVACFHWQHFGTGQSGTSVRIALAYEPETTGPATLVAKFASPSPEARSFANAAGMYEREVRFYNELAGQLPVCAPTALYSRLDPVSGGFVIVMDDLAEARIVDQLIGCSADEAALVMEQAAALHGGSWCDSGLQAREWLKGTARAIKAIADGLPQYYEDYFRVFGEMFGAEAMAAAEIMVGLREQWATLAAETYCLWHQDFRSDNMLFDAKNGDIPLAIVDWQTIGIGRGMSDIAYFIGTSLPTEVRRDSERHLVEHYHRELVARGVRDYSFDQCWLHYRQNVAQGVFTVIHAAPRSARTERGDRMWQSWAQRTAVQAEDLETFKELAAL